MKNKNKKVISVFLAVLFFVANNGKAQTISEISQGDISHGNSISISGSGFGTKLSVQPVVWDDVEDGECNTVATIGSWSSVHSLITGVTNNRSENSSYNCTINFTSETLGSFTGGSNSNKWYLQYWFFLDNDWDWGTSVASNLGNIKILRMWSTGDVLENYYFQLIGSYDSNLKIERTQIDGLFSPVVPGYDWVDIIMGYSDPGYVDPTFLGWKHYEDDITKGAWHLFQFQISESDIDTANGSIKWWYDGKLIFSHNDLITRTTEYSSLKRPFILGFYNSNGTGADGNDHFYMDDAYIDNTFSRIEVGNNPNYDSCIHREIQIPTSWSDSSIQFTFNQGSFNTGDQVYLFVVDENGIPSEGYPLIIGESSIPTETCTDNIQNQDETGIDCGGVCEACIVPTTYGLSNFISSITNWLGIGDSNSDVNSDGIVNTRDLGVMMSGWGE